MRELGIKSTHATRLGDLSPCDLNIITGSDAEIHHVSPPNYPLDDLGEVPSSNVLEEESEDGTIETLRAMRPQFLQQYHPTFRALARPVGAAARIDDV